MLQIWRIAAEALNKLPQTANRRRLFSWAHDKTCSRYGE
jgi:hypothetical protein